MRLICGVLMLDGADASDRLMEAMIAQLAVRRLRPSVARHTRGPAGLAVIDFSARGAQAHALPATAGTVLAADVRLHARKDVAKAAACDPGGGDDALLLAILGRGGPQALAHVLGDFAFAAWDGAALRLTLGRDVFGVRPLSYVHLPGKIFAFASLPKALYGSGIVPKVLDEDAFLRRVAMRLVHDDCLVRSIRRLPPAHVLEVSAAGLKVERYWQLDRKGIGAHDVAAEEASMQLRAALDEAVRCRLPEGSEIGAHLSGGLDSSAITVMAARSLRAQGRRLHAYSFLDRLRNDVALEDETAFVKAVVDQEPGLDWSAVRPPAGLGIDAARDPDTMLRASADDPDVSVCASAARQGVDVILSGWGGDEAVTFNGRGALAELVKRGQWAALRREVAALQAERGWPLHNIVGSEIARYLLPAGATALLDRVRGHEPGIEDGIGMLLTPDARQRLAQSGGPRLAMTGDARENRWRLVTSPHIAERAEHWAQIGAAHGIAFAFPLLDRRLVELALSLPSGLFLRGGTKRRLFRDAMVGVLPDNVRLRHAKYQAFPSAMIDMADAREECLAQIEGYRRVDAVRRLIDLDALARLVAAFPSADTVRDSLVADQRPAGVTALVVASDLLDAAAYLAQHGGAAPDAAGGDGWGTEAGPPPPVSRR